MIVSELQNINETIIFLNLHIIKGQVKKISSFLITFFPKSDARARILFLFFIFLCLPIMYLVLEIPL